MKSFYKYLCGFALLISLSTCKKYDEGGFVAQTRMHLFGGHKAGDSKTWKLKKYEVNGIDSTNLIIGGNNIPDFYSKFITFKYNGSDPSPQFTANTFLSTFSGTIDKAYKKLNIGLYTINWTREDSAQCKTISNINYCERNILLPEISKRVCSWNIRKLTKKELIIEINQANSYKIILSQ